MSENGDKIQEIVKLFIDNINESTRFAAKDREKMVDELDKIKTKLTTPPRNEELSDQMDDVEGKVDDTKTILITINQSIRSMIITVRVALAVLTLALLLAAGVVQYGNWSENRYIDKIEKRMEILEKAANKYDGESEKKGQN